MDAVSLSSGSGGSSSGGSRGSDSDSGSGSGSGDKMQLKKRIGLLEGVAIIVGIIIGSGIFISPKGVLQEVGSVGVSLLLWCLCGLLSMLGAVCYVELGTMIPKSGGDYAYVSDVFGAFPSFIYLWAANVIFVPTTNAIMALTFGEYALQSFYSGCATDDRAVRLLAAAAICLLTFINCYNIRFTTRLQNTFMVTKLLALLTVIAVGVVYMATGRSNSFADAFDNAAQRPARFAVGFYSGIYSYAGWNYLNYMTEELRDPYKNLPRAIYISLPLVTVIYVLANVAYLTVLTPAEMLSSNAIAVTFANRSLGSFAWIMPVFVAFSAFGALSIHIMTSSRLCFVGARDHMFPSCLSMINVNFYTPAPALITLCVLSLLYLTTSDIYALINYTSIVETSFILLSVVALLLLRWKRPDKHRPVKVCVLIPLCFLLVCTFLVALSVYTEPTQAGFALAITATGVPVYWTLLRRPAARPQWLRNANAGLTQFVQKFFLAVKEE